MPKAQRRLLILGLIALDALGVAAAIIGADRWVYVQTGIPNGFGSLPLLI
jgi:hypothetical protein